MEKDLYARLSVLVAVNYQEEATQITNTLKREHDFFVEEVLSDGFLLQEKVRTISPDLIVLDYHLKNISMSQFIEEVQLRNPSMTIILLIDESDYVDLTRFYDASVRNIVARPLNYNELPAMLRSAFLISFKKRKAQASIYRNRKPGIVIAFSSAKGGVGKSFLSANLSLVLANLKNNFKVLLLDFALPYGDQRAIMGIPPNTTQSVMDLINIAEEITPDRIAAVAVKSTVYPNVDVILSSNSKKNEADFAQTVPLVLKALRRVYDFIIIDLNPGLDEVTSPCLEKADKILLVFTPEIPSIYRLIHFLKDFQWLKIMNPPEIIYNRRTKKSDREVGSLLSKVLPYKVFSSISEDIRTATYSLNFLTPAVTRKSVIRKDILSLSQKVLEWFESDQQDEQ
jgi:pilus assembly protein CpaE